MPFPWLRFPRKSPSPAHRLARLSVEALDERVLPSATMVTALNSATLDGVSPYTQPAALNGALYFAGSNGPQVGLFRSDGTAAGTSLVKAFSGPSIYAYPEQLTVYHGALYFAADDGQGQGLWKSDGTAAGTTLVKRVDCMAEPPAWNGLASPATFVVVGDTLYFAAIGNTGSESELWKTDGTPAGTVPVGDQSLAVHLGPISEMTAVNGKLFFVASDPTDVGIGEHLWMNDGTAAGTQAVTTAPGIDELMAVGNTLYFRLLGPQGEGLWKTDGTAKGTTQVKAINPQPPAGLPLAGDFASVGGTLYFPVADPTSGPQLWKTDGTAAGTAKVKDVAATAMAVVHGTLYFMGTDSAHGAGLWKSDGTAAGTALIKANDAGTYQTDLTAVNGALYYAANDGARGPALWKSDGAAAGTVLLKDISPNHPTSWQWWPGLFTNVNGKLFFLADDGLHGGELWASDGTAAGTAMVKDLNPWNAGGYPGQLTAVNGTLFFTALNGTAPGLYKTDGTAAGTVLLKAGAATGLRNDNGTLLFTTDDVNGERLWRSDGTPAGTVPVMTLPASSMPGMLEDFAVVHGVAVFPLNDSAHGTELWRSDGTAAGTFRLKDINPGQADSTPQNLTVVNNTLFFTADDGHGEAYGMTWPGTGLWKTDGTAAGTVLVKDFNPAGSTTPPTITASNLTAVGGTLFFTTFNNLTGVTQLWKSDGTAAGTVLVKTVYALNLMAVGGTLFFSVPNGSSGDQLWKSDGTAAGTVMVTQLPGTVDPGRVYIPPAPSPFGGTFFFSLTDAAHGSELWKSDGTAAGTALLKDLNPGPTSSYPNSFTAVGRKVYFFTNNTAVGGGPEWWQSDGTAAGTVRVASAEPGLPDGPTDATVINGTVYFTGSDGPHGSQVWKLGPAPAGGLSAQVAGVKAQDGQAFSGVVATFTDPTGPGGSYTATITWGDGHTTAGTVSATGKGSYAVSGGNTYARAGSYPLSVKISKVGGGTVTATGTATVTDSEWWAGRTFERVKKGQSTTVVLGSVTDTNRLASAGDFTVQISWGDGQTSAGLLRPNAKGGFDIVGTHTYSVLGSFTLQVTITETGGDTVVINPLIAVDP